MSDDVRVEVLPVPEDSIVWCHNCVFAGDDDGAWGGGLVKALKRAIGHDRFLVLLTADDAVVDVIGEDEVVVRVRAALDRDPAPIAPWESVSTAGFPEWIEDAAGHRYVRSDLGGDSDA